MLTQCVCAEDYAHEICYMCKVSTTCLVQTGRSINLC